MIRSLEELEQVVDDAPDRIIWGVYPGLYKIAVEHTEEGSWTCSLYHDNTLDADTVRTADSLANLYSLVLLSDHVILERVKITHPKQKKVMGKKGRIFADYWVQCGRCEYMEALATIDPHDAQKVARERGWRRRYPHGMVCADCVQQTADQDAARMGHRSL